MDQCGGWEEDYDSGTVSQYFYYNAGSAPIHWQEKTLLNDFASCLYDMYRFGQAKPRIFSSSILNLIVIVQSLHVSMWDTAQEHNRAKAIPWSLLGYNCSNSVFDAINTIITDNDFDKSLLIPHKGPIRPLNLKYAFKGWKEAKEPPENYLSKKLGLSLSKARNKLATVFLSAYREKRDSNPREHYGFLSLYTKTHKTELAGELIKTAALPVLTNTRTKAEYEQTLENKLKEIMEAKPTLKWKAALNGDLKNHLHCIGWLDPYKKAYAAYKKQQRTPPLSVRVVVA